MSNYDDDATRWMPRLVDWIPIAASIVLMLVFAERWVAWCNHVGGSVVETFPSARHQLLVFPLITVGLFVILEIIRRWKPFGAAMRLAKNKSSEALTVGAIVRASLFSVLILLYFTWYVFAILNPENSTPANWSPTQSRLNFLFDVISLWAVAFAFVDLVFVGIIFFSNFIWRNK